VLNHYYAPGVEATGRLLAELCAGLADDFEVTVVTGSLADAGPGRARVEGVEVIRVRSTAFARRKPWLRALNYTTFLAQCLRVAVRAERPDIVFAMTDPPLIGAVALVVARRFRVPLVVVSQDVFPETAARLGRVDNALVVHTLRMLTTWYLRNAQRVVAIGETMRGRLVAKGAPPGRVVVIPNWVDTQSLTPSPRKNDWAERNGLAEGFVVMHSGNVGHAQDLETLIRAATLLRDLDDLTVAIVGDGVRRTELEALARRIGATNVRFLPFQPRETLSESLSAADVHVVGLAAGLAGYVVPSRIYGILAAARPVICAAEAESETAQLVERAGCGVVVAPGSPEQLAHAIRGARDRELDLDRMGKRGREYVVAEADRAQAVARYRELLLHVA
jgi:putative colanic acid biosynthesis glycosyltransferase WcaI